MIISDKQISPPSLAWSFTFTKSYTDEFQRQYSWKEYPWRNSTDAQSFVFAVISFLSQIIVSLCFNFTGTHFHTQKQKKKITWDKKLTTTFTMLDGEICSHDVHMLEGYCCRHNNIMTQQLHICDRCAI